MPAVPPKPTDSKLLWSRLAILATVIFWLAYVVTTIIRQFLNAQMQGFRVTMEAIGYVVIVTLLATSALAYLIAREGALRRFSKHERAPRAAIDHLFEEECPSITVLIPSYAEEPRVIRQTMISVALQEYENMRIVLAIDDPPNPSSDAAKERLEQARAMPIVITELFAEPFEYVLGRKNAWENNEKPNDKDALQGLAQTFEWSASWLRQRASMEPQEDHVDDFLVNHVILELASDFQKTAMAIRMSANEQSNPLSPSRIGQLYSRLTATFHVQADSFERKAFISTSHEANKAMNLNSYIALMGGSYKFLDTGAGTILEPCDDADLADLVIPDSDFLLTLDADSVLLREYCLRLVYLMKQPENARVAVAQTPYSSFRGAATRIERLAGATTDLQHIQHQGMTAHGATFWVGANAVIRKSAIDEIAEVDTERGFTVKRYIQDRTVIEDTESSIDMVNHGWTLVNYPERLSYSATPPDFGSLVVQRQRWANGGLLILPKMLSKTRKDNDPTNRLTFGEATLRFNYMASIGWASFSLVLLLAYPYDGRLLSPLVVLLAAPYFLAMASDLHACGYKRTDVFRIYGFNLILLPVNLAGVLTSLRQGLSGRKIPFARTPKVKNRTVTPVKFIVLPVAIIVFSFLTLVSDYSAENWGNAAFALFNGVLASWAFISYIGIKDAIVDTWIGAINFLFVDVPAKTENSSSASATRQWREVLDVGPELPRRVTK